MSQIEENFCSEFPEEIIRKFQICVSKRLIDYDSKRYKKIPKLSNYTRPFCEFLLKSINFQVSALKN